MYPKKVGMLYPLEVLMCQFNDLASLRRFSFSDGRDMPDEADDGWNSGPQ